MQNSFARMLMRASTRSIAVSVQRNAFNVFSTRAQVNTNFFTVKRALQALTVGSVMYIGHRALRQEEQEYYEKVIDANFAEGERRAVQLGPKEDDAVMVVKFEGKYHCLNDKCPHFGFSMTKGPMFDDKVVCPLHMASFSVLSGLPEYGPTFDGLEKYEVEVLPPETADGPERLRIRVPKSKLNVSSTAVMVRRNPSDKRRFLIIGGGPAGLSAAETLRKAGFGGEITVLAKENVLAYDRTLLSKNLLGVEVDKVKFRDDKFFKEHDINFEVGVEVKNIDTLREFVETKDGRHLHYEGLIIATGGRPRVPNVPGTNLKNVYTLREWEDVKNIKQGLQKAKKLVIIGGSFIGLESASSIKAALKDNIDIVVCDEREVPFQRALGSEVGSALKIFSEQNGVNFKLSSVLTSIEGDEAGNVKRVKFANGDVIEADAVLLGTGMMPNSSFVTSNIKKDPNGAILTDIYQRTNVKNVWAVGDVAAYPYFQSGQFLNVQHYNDSIFQGYIAGLNILGKMVANDNVPFFWTRFFNKSLQYTGAPGKYDEVFIDGNVNEQKFIAWYFWNNRVVAAAAMGVMPHIQVVNEALRRGIEIKADDIKAGRVKIDDIKEKVKAKGRACRCKRQLQCQH